MASACVGLNAFISERDDAVKKKRKKDDDDDDSDEGGDSDGDQMRVKGYQYFLGQEETTV